METELEKFMIRHRMINRDEPRLLGWTQANWSVIAGQMPYGVYAPTLEGALSMKTDWMASKNEADLARTDEHYARNLFENLRIDSARVRAIPAEIVGGAGVAQNV